MADAMGRLVAVATWPFGAVGVRAAAECCYAARVRDICRGCGVSAVELDERDFGRIWRVAKRVASWSWTRRSWMARLVHWAQLALAHCAIGHFLPAWPGHAALRARQSWSAMAPRFCGAATVGAIRP
ncbi:hypothetical protein FVE85_8886 [Porphyridium purpureum]|uniref:Uncharacterized protein n=1 Tax=Porphyridium purpureum TaxID=35688 RepID=A0A5J4YPJ5_PORPP|nr:hypothetical protein FVE85_8886 [Porphyridium purpureum]|eukprot:POR4034..scf296_7